MSGHPITLLNKVVKSNSNSKNTSPHQPTLYVSTEKKSIEDKYAITNTKTGMYIPTNAPQVFQPKPISVVSIIMDTSVKKGSPKQSDISLHKRPEYTIVSPVSSFKIGDFSLFTSDVDTNPEKTTHSEYGTKKVKALPKLQLSSIPTARSDSSDINTQKVNFASTRKVKAASSLSTPLKASPRPLLNSYRPSDFSKQGIQNPNIQKTVPVKPLPLNTERVKNNNSSGGRKLMLLSSTQEKTGRRANKSEGMPTVMSARQQHQESHAFYKKPNDLTVDFKDCFKPVLNSRSKMMFKNAELLLKKYKDLKFK